MTSAIIYIDFTIVYAQREYKIRTHWGAYRDLRKLIIDKLNIELFGECGGVGRCGTCILTLMNRFNSTMNRKDLAYQLSCQTPVTDELTDSIIIIE
jgi:ferredoxin, 2Fe-2S